MLAAATAAAGPAHDQYDCTFFLLRIALGGGALIRLTLLCRAFSFCSFFPVVVTGAASSSAWASTASSDLASDSEGSSVSAAPDFFLAFFSSF